MQPRKGAALGFKEVMSESNDMLWLQTGEGKGTHPETLPEWKEKAPLRQDQRGDKKGYGSLWTLFIGVQS